MTARSVCISFVFFLSFFSSTQAAILTFTDQLEWERAVTAKVFHSENFEGSAIDFSTNSSGNKIGRLAVDLVGGGNDPGPSGLTGSGYFQGEVDSSGLDALAIRFSFEQIFGFALIGIQNDSFSNPSRLDLEEIAIGIDAEYWILSEQTGVRYADIAFLGFVSDGLINSFEFSHAALLNGITRSSEEFYLDGIIIASNPVSIPEPSMIVLFLAGLSGLLILAKRRRRNG